MRALAYAAAVAAPAAVLAAGVGAMAAGGQAPTTDALPGVLAEVAEQADVVLIGNSMTGSDIDTDALAEAVGAQSVSNPRVAGSGAATWLAVLEARVATSARPPRLVVVYGTLEAMLSWKPEGEGLARLNDVLGGADGVVARRVLEGGGVWGRIRASRAGFHGALTDTVRNAGVGLAFGGEGDSLTARGASVAQPALDALFGAKARLRKGGGERVSPVKEEAAAAGFAATVGAGESLFAELVAASHRMGARFLFVRAPDRPLRPSTRALEAEGAALVGIANQLGAGVIDLSYLRPPPSQFTDYLHMNATGQQALMAALVPELERLDPLGAEVMPPAVAPVFSLGVERVGAPVVPAFGPARRLEGCAWEAPAEGLAALGNAALQAVGLGASSPLLLRVGEEAVAPTLGARQLGVECVAAAALTGTGLRFTAPESVKAHDVALALSADFPLLAPGGEEAWWVYPGTTARVELAAVSEATIQLAGRRIGKGSASFRVGGAEVAVPEGEGPFDLELRAAPGGRAWAAELSSAGPFLRIERLQVVQGEQARVVLGGYETNVPARVKYAAPGPEVVLVPAGEDLYNAPAVVPLGTPEVQADRAISCLGLEVSVDGEAVPFVAAGQAGTAFERGWAVVGSQLRIRPAGAVAARLAAGRICRLGARFYPGERASVILRPELGRLRLGATEVGVKLRAYALGAAERVRVRVHDRSGTLAERELEANELRGETVWLPLAAPLPAAAGTLRLELENPSATAFVVASPVEFRESPTSR